MGLKHTTPAMCCVVLLLAALLLDSVVGLVCPRRNVNDPPFFADVSVRGCFCATTGTDVASIFNCAGAGAVRGALGYECTAADCPGDKQTCCFSPCDALALPGCSRECVQCDGLDCKVKADGTACKSTTEQCRTTSCRGGFCVATEPLPATTSCNDTNAATFDKCSDLTDLCDGAGICGSGGPHCPGANKTLRVSISDVARAARFDWPTLFRCPYNTVIKREPNVQTSTVVRSAGGEACANIDTINDQQFLISNTEPPGSKMEFTLTGTISNKIPSIVLRGALIIAYDATIVVEVLATNTRSPIGNRGITLRVVNKHMLFGTVEWIDERMTTTRGDAASAVTNSQGQVVMRIVVQASHNSGNPQDLSQLTIDVTPQAGDGATTFDYAECSAPCSRQHVLTHAPVMLVPAKVSFEDKSIVTVRGKFSFYGFPACGAPDMKLTVVDLVDESKKIADVMSDPVSGVVAFSLSRGSSVKIMFHRATLPDYLYVSTFQVPRASQNLTIVRAMSDVTLDLSDAQAASYVRAYDGASVSMPYYFEFGAGLCDMPIALVNPPLLRFESSSCTVDVELFSTSMTASGSHGFVLALPPLKFVVSDFKTGLAQYDAYFGSDAFPDVTFDARLPSLPRDGSPRVVASKARPASVLSNLLALYIPLLTSVDDESINALASRATLAESKAPTFAAILLSEQNATTGLQLMTDGAGVSFGAVPALDVSAEFSISFWLSVANISATSSGTLFAWHDGISVPDVSLVVIANTASMFTIALQTRTASQMTVVHVATTTLSNKFSHHVALTIAAGRAQFFVNGTSNGGVDLNANDVFRRLFAHECSLFLKYRCIRTFIVGASNATAAAQLNGTLADVAIWRRTLAAGDIAFIHAVGRDGRRLRDVWSGTTLGAKVLFRAPVEIEIPPDLRRASTPEPTSMSDLYLGVSIAPRSCNAVEPGASVAIHSVNETSLLSIVVLLFETYGGKRCPMTSGSFEMRSTFTSQCLVVPGASQTACTGTFSAAYGFLNFRAVVGKPELLPVDPLDQSKPSRLNTNSLSLEDLKTLYLGEFNVRFKGARNNIDESLWFHVSGQRGPPNANVLPLPLNEVPLIRLHKPPGDQSSAFLTRNWASSVRIGMSADAGAGFGLSLQNFNELGIGLDSMVCLDGMVYANCQTAKAAVYASFSTASQFEYSFSKSISLSEAYSNELMVEFATTINDKAIGKDGDVLVTSGMTLLISDSYTVGLDSCTITQRYAPTWRPAPNMSPDSLQLTLRRDIPSLVEAFRVQSKLIDEQCGGVLNATRTTLLMMSDDALVALVRMRCVKEIGSTVVELDDVKLRTIVVKWRQAVSGHGRWLAIKQNWDSVYCEALGSTGTQDALCPKSTSSATTGLASAQVFSLLQTSKARAAAEAYAASLSPGSTQAECDVLVRTLGGSPAAEVERAAQRRRCADAAVSNGAAQSTYPQLPQTGGITKVSFTGGTQVAFASTSTSTRDDSYTMSNFVSTDLAFEAAVRGTLAFTFSFDGRVSIGGHASTMFSNSMTSERSKSDSTTIGFTLSDDDIGDQFGVSVFVDPTYATPIFITTGGATSCPAEAGTNVRQELTVTPKAVTSISSVDPDAPIQLPAFGARILSARASDAGADWTYYLQVSNEDDLTVTYVGSPLTQGSNFPKVLSNTASTSFAPIVVKRGQRFRYENVTISLASSCDSNVVHSALFNLEWTSKCSLVAIDTDRSASALFLSDRAFFVINSQTAPTVNVTVRNPSPSSTPWTLIEGSFRVRLQYRAVGEQSQWTDVALPAGASFPTRSFCKNTAKGDVSSCFNDCATMTGLNAPCTAMVQCCQNGVQLACVGGRCAHAATVDSVTIAIDSSAFGSAEGLYEMRAISACGEGEKATTTTSGVVSGRVDRLLPRLFGDFQEPADKLWWPGDSMSMRFTESVTCDRPFSFDVTITRANGSAISVGRDLDVLCINEKIEVAFSRTLILASPSIAGEAVTLTIGNVLDLARNAIAAPAQWAFRVGMFDAARATVSLSDVRVSSTLTSNEDIIKALFGANATLSQFLVSGSRTRSVMETMRSVDVTIKEGEALTLARQALMMRSSLVDTSRTLVALASSELQVVPTTQTQQPMMTTPPSASPLPMTTAAVVLSGQTGAGLPLGAVIGIAVGAGVVGLLVLVAIGYLIVRHRRGGGVASESSTEMAASPTSQSPATISLPPPPPEVVKRVYTSENSGRSKRVVRSEFSRRVREEAAKSAVDSGLPIPPPPWQPTANSS